MLLVVAGLWSVDVCCEGRRFRRLQVESYALRIVIESGSVNLTAYNLESDWLNLGGSQSIPGADSDLQHKPAYGRSASHQPRKAPRQRPGDGRFRPRQTAHPSRVPGTAILGEDCDFLQMTEVPPASSVNAVLGAKVRSRSAHPAPRTTEVSRLATFQSPPASPRHTPPPRNQP